MVPMRICDLASKNTNKNDSNKLLSTRSQICRICVECRARFGYALRTFQTEEVAFPHPVERDGPFHTTLENHHRNSEFSR